jgi:hypothetical protein
MTFSEFFGVPLAVYCAIGLFLIKECLEYRRRKTAQQKKLTVYKKLIAQECERNNWFIKSVSRIGQTVEKRPNAYRVEKQKSGILRLLYVVDGEGRGSGILPEVYRSKIEAMAKDVAELDPDLFEKIDNALDSISDLAHVRSSIIDYEVIDEKLSHEAFYVSFWDFAEQEMRDAELVLADLYMACTGNALEDHRLR